MGTDKLLFEGEQWGATGSDVSHVTGNDPVQKYVLRMRNQKLRHIRKWP